MVDAVLRALKLVEAMSARPDGMGVSELADLEGVNKALVHRALASLVAGGWATQDQSNGRYRLSGRLLKLAGHFYRGLGLYQVANSILQPLAERTSCHVEITRYFDGAPRVLLAVAPSTFPTGLQVVSHVGDRQTPHATAAGKIWLASLSSDELERFLTSSELRRLTPQTVTDATSLRAEVDKVRRLGVAFNRREDSEGIFGVAVPIRHGPIRDSFVGALGLARLHTTVSEEDEPLLAQEAREAAAALSELIPIWEPLPR